MASESTRPVNSPGWSRGVPVTCPGASASYPHYRQGDGPAPRGTSRPPGAQAGRRVALEPRVGRGRRGPTPRAGPARAAPLPGPRPPPPVALAGSRAPAGPGAESGPRGPGAPVDSPSTRRAPPPAAAPGSAAGRRSRRPWPRRRPRSPCRCRRRRRRRGPPRSLPGGSALGPAPGRGQRGSRDRGQSAGARRDAPTAGPAADTRPAGERSLSSPLSAGDSFVAVLARRNPKGARESSGRERRGGSTRPFPLHSRRLLLQEAPPRRPSGRHLFRTLPQMQPTPPPHSTPNPRPQPGHPPCLACHSFLLPAPPPQLSLGWG